MRDSAPVRSTSENFNINFNIILSCRPGVPPPRLKDFHSNCYFVHIYHSGYALLSSSIGFSLRPRQTTLSVCKDGKSLFDRSMAAAVYISAGKNPLVCLNSTCCCPLITSAARIARNQNNGSLIYRIQNFGTANL